MSRSAWAIIGSKRISLGGENPIAPGRGLFIGSNAIEPDRCREQTSKNMAKTLPQDNKPQTRPTHEQIAKRASEIFEESGRKPGQDMENWLAAEAELMKTHKAQTQPANGTKLLARPTHREPVPTRA